MKVGKNFKIFGVREGMVGDLIMALPILNYLESVYEGSYKYWAIGKRFSNCAPLFINHPLIDKIWILEEAENLGKRDWEEAKGCNVFINPLPNHPDGFPTEDKAWWNDYTCCEETFRMAGFDVKEYWKMGKDLTKPKLEKWFDIERYDKTIAIWPFAAYGKGDAFRSPSVKWWENFVERIGKQFPNYKIVHLGHDDEPNIKTLNTNYYRRTGGNLTDQFKLALGCDVSIGTDSGSSWVIGAYGHPQITLLAPHHPHKRNYLAFAPENYKGNNANLFCYDGCDGIFIDEVIDHINLHIK